MDAKRKMKSLLLFTFVLVIVVFVAACGNNSATQSNNNTTNSNSNNSQASNTSQAANNSNESNKSIDYPTKEITIIVPNRAGGSTDMIARTIQPFLEKKLGVPVLIKNVAGAGGNIGQSEAYKSKPDGYTLLTTPMPSFALTEVVGGGDFKVAEFVPVYNLTGNLSQAIVVPYDSPIQTIEDLKEASKQKTLNASGSGAATNSGLASVILKSQLDLQHQLIPFDSGTEANTQVAGGNMDFGISSEESAKALIHDKKVRAIVYTGPERSAVLPDVPTLVESGYPDAYFNSYYGFYAPPGTSKEIVNILAAAFDEAVKDQEFLDVAEKTELVLQPMGPEQFEQQVKETISFVESVKDLFDIQ